MIVSQPAAQPCRYLANFTLALGLILGGYLFPMASVIAQIPSIDAPPRPLPPPPPHPTTFASFPIQGEYQGWMVVDGRKQDYALQVVGTGKRTLRAVLLIGRLPGLGTAEFTSATFKGKIAEDGSLQLTSEGGITLQYDPASSVFLQKNLAGDTIGWFQKVTRTSPTMGLEAPADAVPLFVDQLQHWQGAKLDSEGLLMPGAVTDFPVGGFHMHLEFKIPYQPEKSQQARGNSGVYIQRRYELQILDSFGEPNRFNYCGSLYRQRPSSILMSLPPEQWQTYDIWFTPAKFVGDIKVAHAQVTLKHNGVVVHNQVPIINKTGAGQKEGPQPLPILLQDHGDPVRFRNIWLVHQPDPTP